KAFNNPKDHFELAKVLDYVTGKNPEAIILDFFGGSGSTAQAVMQMNLADGGCRRFLMIQVTETLDPDKQDPIVAAMLCDRIQNPRAIAEITKERLRRAARELSAEVADPATSSNPGLGWSATPNLDFGFRVLKVDTSNMKDVYYQPDAVAQVTLAGF